MGFVTVSRKRRFRPFPVWLDKITTGYGRGWQGKQKKGDSDRIRKNLIRFSFLGMLFCFESASKQKLLGFVKFEDFSSK